MTGHSKIVVRDPVKVTASRCSKPGTVTQHRGLWQTHVRRVLAALADLPDN